MVVGYRCVKFAVNIKVWVTAHSIPDLTPLGFDTWHHYSPETKRGSGNSSIMTIIISLFLPLFSFKNARMSLDVKKCGYICKFVFLWHHIFKNVFLTPFIGRFSVVEAAEQASSMLQL